MKTYNKLLAVACITCCTNVHADTINWEEVSHFFNFDTIAEEKRTNLATNIRLLVEEQLKLPSGQNLWKAFQFWEQQHPELGFQFEFTLTANPGAEVILESLKNSFEGKQVFCFEILINKLFAEKLKADQILSENMLYRPCLIKLVDSDDPEKWEYHLREQELPFFITLAHEFLHALNQLERIDLYWFSFSFDSQDKDILAILEATISMENFLAKKFGISNDSIIFQKTCKELWGNNHFLDEMTVILGSERKIGEVKFVFIGETTFLREYFQDNTIISWSHDSARNIKFWQKMSAILNKNYVNEIFESNCFCVCELNIQHVCINLNPEIQKNYLFKYNNSLPFKDYIKAIEKNMNKIKHLNYRMAIRISILSEANKSKNIQAFEILKTSKKHNINLLPKYYTTIYLEGYTIEDLSNNSDIVLYEDLFKKFKLLIENEEGVLLKINEENKVQYYEYKPSKKRHYFSTLKENQQIYDIINKVKSQNLYYYNGISFQKLLKN